MRLEANELPFTSSEIAPVHGNAMKPVSAFAVGSSAIARFAEENLALYEELHRYTRIAMDWATLLARRPRKR